MKEWLRGVHMSASGGAGVRRFHQHSYGSAAHGVGPITAGWSRCPDGAVFPGSSCCTQGITCLR